MTLLQSILLGIIQGITEFLPVSSSAHLVLTPFLFGWDIPANEAFLFDVLVQVATILAVIAYFWKDLLRIATSWVRFLLAGKPFADPDARLGWLIILATIPAGLAGVLIKDLVEQAFSSPAAVAVFLLVTALLLVVAERIGKRSRSLAALTWVDALLIGVAQAVSIFPGISRSGSTITGGMMRNLDRPAAARFSFFMSVPIMLAAGLLALLDLAEMPNLAQLLPVFIPGFIVSAVVGYLSIHWLLRFLTHRPLYVFSIYCALLGLVTLAVYWLR